MKRAPFLIMLVGVCVILAACGGTPDVTVTPTLAPVKDSAAIKAEGKLQPPQSADLSFATGGEVAEVLVKEGAAVNAGDVIARVKSDAQQIAVARAEAGVAAAKANQAQYLEQLPQQIAAAQAEVQAAQAQIAATSAQHNDPAAIAAAESAVYQAQVSQRAAEDAYQNVIDKELLGPTEERARLVMQNAKAMTIAAELRLKQLTSGSANYRATAAEIDAAKTRLTAAQARLDELTAEANGRPDPTYAAAIQQAEAALYAAQIAVADTELRAPFAGSIAQLNLKAGETAAPGVPAAILADFSSWQVKTDDLTEIKVPGVQAGQSVVLRFDALPDLELKGVVESIGILNQTSSGDIVYPVTIKLLDSDPQLRWGMTAVVEFGQ